MHGARVYFSDQNLNPNSQVEGTNTHFDNQFKTFLQHFNRDNTLIYKKRIEYQIRSRRYVLPVDVSDLRSFDEQLFDRLTATPLDILGIMEKSVQNYVQERLDEYPLEKIEEWQVVLRSDDHPIRIRDIKSGMVSKMFVISGIIISTTKPYIKASCLKLQCRSCLSHKTINLQPGQWPYIPTYCEGVGGGGQQQKCQKDPFVALPSSDVIDSQSLRIQ